MTLSEALARMHASQEFQAVMKEAQNHRPLLFPMDPSKPIEDQAAKLMYLSGQQNGWDLLMGFLMKGKV